MGAHDRLFRSCFAGLDEALWLVRRVLPRSTSSDIRLLPTDALAEGMERRPDLAIALQEPPRALLVQHQSTVEATMHLRVALDEALFLRAAHNADTPVHDVRTLVLYQGLRTWPRPPDSAWGTSGAYHLIRLQDLSEAQRRRAPLRARLAIRFLCAGATRHEAAIWACLRTERVDLLALRQLRGREAISDFVRYVLATTNLLNREAMMAQLQRVDDDLQDDFISTYDRILQEGVERGKQEGLLQGREEGRQEGRQEGREDGRRSAHASTLRRIGDKHLPTPTPTQRERIAQASASQLEAWIEQLLQDAPPRTWDDLLG